MRGLEKPRPPTNVRPDGQTPQQFVDAEREYLAALGGRTNKSGFARSEFGQLHKVKLRRVMNGEQGSICVYCERRLAESASPPPVEHWRPLHAVPEFAIHWNNLYLSCATRNTCDDRKGGQPLKADSTDRDLPWPTEFAYECVVGFTSGGRMYVRNDVELADATRRALELAIDDVWHDGRRRKSILNLNHPSLLEARRASLDSEQARLERKSSQHVQSSDERTDRAAQILGQDPRPEHVSIRVAWLLNSLGRGL